MHPEKLYAHSLLRIASISFIELMKRALLANLNQLDLVQTSIFPVECSQVRIMWLWCMVLCACLSDVTGIWSHVVRLREGKVRGWRSVSGQNRFYGITYATSQRFQPPREPPRWSGVLNAVDRFSNCAQTMFVMKLGVEDCQKLDVYQPENAKPTDKLPVLVFFHGGAYYYGSKLHYDPEFLVTKRTVVVVVNYRVGVLGFLCAAGVANLGLKDQVAALRWIKRNIAAFGGDPDNVTISGQSAGASAVGMHLLTPSTKGLFHKAILLSGNPLAPWAFNLEPLKPAIEDANKLGNATTEDDVLRIFSEASLSDLLDATKDISSDTRYFKYSPCVDVGFSQPLFPGKPFDLFQSGSFHQVPVMLGYTSLEGILFYGLHDKYSLQEFKQNFIEKLPSIFSWCSIDDKKLIAMKLWRHYVSSKSPSVKAIVNYYSDWIAYSSMDAFSSLLVNTSSAPVYKYLFKYEGERNFAKFVFGSNVKLKGASHSDDIFYIFKPAGLSLLLSSDDKLFIDRFTTAITNFMRTGNPTPYPTKLLPVPWTPSSTNSIRSMTLDRRFTMTATERSGYLQRLMCAFGQPGYVPCKSEALCRPG